MSGDNLPTPAIAPALLQVKDGKRNRLMITHIECENFKSYAGTQTIGPFHKCFSSIVGPNGSGKSNVIDALLFVFGKRAHQLRLKKVSELIHKSSTFPSLEFARVSVFFQVITDDEASEDDFEVIEDSQFTVSRFAYADGESKYFIGDKKSSFTEVGQLLRSYQIDLDNNRFLILQGEVEQIAMMKPKGASPSEEGLLEYLEDIIGSNVFLEKIEQTGKLLEEVNEQRVDKVQRLKTAERERDNLTESKIEVEVYLQKESDLRQKKNLVFQHNLSLNQSKLNQVNKQLGDAKEKLSVKKAEMREIDDLFHRMEKEYENLKKQHLALEKELSVSSTQFDSLERKDVKVTEEMKHCKANIKKAQNNLHRDQKKHDEIQPELDTLKAQIEKYRITLQEFEKSKNEAEDELNELMQSLQNETKDLREQLEQEKILLAEAEKSVSSLQAQKDLAENAIDLIRSRPHDVAKSIETLQGKLQKLTADKKFDEEQLQGIVQYEANVFQKAMRSLQKEAALLEQKEQEISEATRALLITIEMQKAAVLTQQAAQQGNKIVQSLLNAAKHHGPLSKAGIRGRLGDLARIPADYDVAITTACGLLDFIVVETVDGGQQCLEYLRKMKIGRASFIVMDQIQQEWSQRLANSQETSYPEPRLFDLLQDFATDDVKSAFYFALRDTLVSRDLDSAVKIAYDGDRAKWRVVTLGGQMIETSGAMSGGGHEVRRGGMRLLTQHQSVKHDKGGKKGVETNAGFELSSEDNDVSEEIIAKNEKTLSELQQQLSLTKEQRKAKEDEIKTLQNEMKIKLTLREKLSLSLQRYTETEQSLMHRLANFETEKDLTAAERRDIDATQQELEHIEAAMSAKAPQLKTLQNRVTILQRDILSMGGMKLTKLQSKIDSYIQQIEMVSKAISTKETEEANIVKSSEKLSNSIAKSEQDVQKHEVKLAQLEKEQREMEADIKAMTAAIELSKRQLNSMEEELKEKSLSYNALKEKNNQLKSIEVDLSMEIEKLHQEKKDVDGQIAYWQKELESLRQAYSAETKELFSTISNLYTSNNLPISDMSASLSLLGGNVIPLSSSSSKAAATADSADLMDVDEDDSSVKSPFAMDALPLLSSEDLLLLNIDEVRRQINLLEAERNKMKGNVNMNALIDYFKKEVHYRLKLKDLEAINEQRNVIRKEYDHYRKQRLEMFLIGFGQISLKLKEMYQMITLGGDAELELIDSLDPFSEGIAFSVRPPKKSWKQISNLSGGEKTLSSLALVFALHYYKPTPLYVMDEIDAALDFKNVSIVANYIKDRTKNAQFIIISLRNNMFELADRLIGIYKTFDITKSVTINPKKFSIPSIAVQNESETENVITKTVKSGSSASTVLLPLSDTTNKLKISK